MKPVVCSPLQAFVHSNNKCSSPRTSGILPVSYTSIGKFWLKCTCWYTLWLKTLCLSIHEGILSTVNVVPEKFAHMFRQVLLPLPSSVCWLFWYIVQNDCSFYLDMAFVCNLQFSRFYKTSCIRYLNIETHEKTNERKHWIWIEINVL